MAGCGGAAEIPEGTLGSAATSPVLLTRTTRSTALSTPAARHLIRLAPPGYAPATLAAVDVGAISPTGLQWFRSDDDGLTWRPYGAIHSGSSIHMNADAIATGMDVEIVVSYDTPNTGFPSDSNDPMRKVYYQRLRYDGAGEWRPDPRITVASPPSGKAYHRAMMQRDSLGRIWIQAWLRDPCSSSAGSGCAETLQVWRSDDDGATFTGPANVHRTTRVAGSRIIHTGTRLVILGGDYSYEGPAFLLWRDDTEPAATWHGPVQAFPDGDQIYHGSAQSAVPDGAGGFHVVYKNKRETLWYRRYDGSSFGTKQQVDASSYYSTQPAITRVGNDVHVCVLHIVESSTPTYEIRSSMLSEGFSSPRTLTRFSTMGAYPSAPEVVTPDALRLPCAYTMGTGGQERTMVAFRETGAPLPTPTPSPSPTATPAPTPSPSPSPSPTSTPTPTPVPTPTPSPGPTSVVALVPVADVLETNLRSVGDSIDMWRNVDDGIGFHLADNDGTYVRGIAGAAFAEHRTRVSAPAGTVVGAKVFFRGKRTTNARGTLQAKLYQGDVLIGTGTLRETTTSWTSWSDTFAGLSITDPSQLRIAIELRNTNGIESIRYTQVWVELEYAAP